jgi:hypothetical protein
MVQASILDWSLELVLEIAQRSHIVERMDIAGDDLLSRTLARATGSRGRSGGCGSISSRYSMMASDCVSTSPESSWSAGTRICGLIAR